MSSEKLGRHGARRGMPGGSLRRNYRTHVFEATRIRDSVKDLFTLPSFQVKLLLGRAPFCCFPVVSESGESSGHPSVLFPMWLWAEELVFTVSDAVGSVLLPFCVRLLHTEPMGKRCLLGVRCPVAFYRVPCSCPESGGKGLTKVTAEKLVMTLSFSHLAWKHRYWFSVTCLQAWLILCKTEDFTAILQKDLKSPDFP